jgi:hypothetical protein
MQPEEFDGGVLYWKYLTSLVLSIAWKAWSVLSRHSLYMAAMNSTSNSNEVGGHYYAAKMETRQGFHDLMEMFLRAPLPVVGIVTMTMSWVHLTERTISTENHVDSFPTCWRPRRCWARLQVFKGESGDASLSASTSSARCQCGLSMLYSRCCHPQAPTMENTFANLRCSLA